MAQIEKQYYTVEVVTAPLAAGERWTKHRDIIDLLPGSIVFEDRDMPRLSCAVISISPGMAEVLVRAALTSVGLVVAELSVRQDDTDTYEALHIG